MDQYTTRRPAQHGGARLLLAATTAALMVLASACGASGLTAEQVVAEITQRVPEATPSVVFTPATDPNDLLGRPNGYTSKASFNDTRIDPETLGGLEEGGVEFGGSVEVFASEDAARKRMDYIQAVLAAAPPILGGSEYDYVRGGVLLRVTGTLTPDQAATYEAALSGIES